MSKGKEAQKIAPMEAPAEPQDDELTAGEEIDFTNTPAALEALFEEISTIKAILELGFKKQIKAAQTASKVRELGAPIGPAAFFKACAISGGNIRMKDSDLVVPADAEVVALVLNKFAAAPEPQPKVTAAGDVKKASDAAKASAAWKLLSKEEKALIAARYAAYVEALPEPELEDA